MLILIFTLLLVHTTPLFSAELTRPTYKKPYTPEQLILLAKIKTEWKTWNPNVSVKRWHLMKEGVQYGLHPDDICREFLLNILHEQYPGNDPHEMVLHKVEFLLKHNANPNGRTTLDGLTASLCMARTYAIARCLLDHNANPEIVDIERDHTLVHRVVNSSYYTAESAKTLIALFCSVGVRPDACTVDGLTPLALLARKGVKYFSADQDSILAETLVKVGTPVDERFEQECAQTRINQPAFAYTIDAIRGAVYRTRQKVVETQKMLRKTRYPALVTMLQDLKLLSGDTATIVASYDLDPHDYFIHQILADADATLQRERQAREDLLKPSRCAIQ